jgi:hypothetical protein
MRLSRASVNTNPPMLLVDNHQQVMQEGRRFRSIHFHRDEPIHPRVLSSYES